MILAVGKGSILRATNAANKNTASTSEINENRSEKAITNSENKNALIEIPLSQIKAVPNSWFSYTHLKLKVDELGRSIEKFGLVEPVILRQMKDNQFQLLSGYRRLDAVKELGHKTILAIVLEEITDQDAREIFRDLHKNSNRDNVHEVKFQVISSIQSDMPEYLL